MIDGTTYSAMPTTGYHGTAVAGLIAAENNGTGTVGVAYGASITGVPILRSSMAPDLLASLWEMDRFDIVNNSWGYNTPFQVNANSSDSFWTSFEGAIVNAGTGRDGLGTIIVKSAGNNRASGNDTNYDNFTNHRQVIAVGAVDHNGMVTHYSTPGANLLVVAPSSTFGVGLTTTDIAGAAGNNSGDYLSSFGGTSAAAPLISGVVALMLEANPDLGWRDVQEILAISARQVGDPDRSPAMRNMTGRTMAPTTGMAAACTSRTTMALAWSMPLPPCGLPKAGRCWARPRTRSRSAFRRP